MAKKIRKSKGGQSDKNKINASVASELTPEGFIKEIGKLKLDDLIALFEPSSQTYSNERSKLFEKSPEVQHAVYLKFIKDPLPLISNSENDKKYIAAALSSLTDDQVLGLTKELLKKHGNNKDKKNHLFALYEFDSVFASRSLAILRTAKEEKAIKLSKQYNNYKENGSIKKDVSLLDKINYNLRSKNFSQREDLLNKFPQIKDLEGVCFGLTLNWLVTENFNRTLFRAVDKGDLLDPLLKEVLIAQFTQQHWDEFIKTRETPKLPLPSSKSEATEKLFKAILEDEQNKNRIVLYTNNHAVGIHVERVSEHKYKLDYFDANHGKISIPFDTRSEMSMTIAKNALANRLSTLGSDDLSFTMHSDGEIKAFIATPREQASIIEVADRVAPAPRPTVDTALAEATVRSSTSASAPKNESNIKTTAKSRNEIEQEMKEKYNYSASRTSSNNSSRANEKTPLLNQRVSPAATVIPTTTTTKSTTNIHSATLKTPTPLQNSSISQRAHEVVKEVKDTGRTNSPTASNPSLNSTGVGETIPLNKNTISQSSFRRTNEQPGGLKNDVANNTSKMAQFYKSKIQEMRSHGSYADINYNPGNKEYFFEKKDFASWKGDELKEKILEKFDQALAKDSSEENINKIRNSAEYKILETGQDTATKLFGLKTTSIEILEERLEAAAIKTNKPGFQP